MPVARQPDVSPGWFASRASQALFASELPSLQQALAARPGLPWLAFSAFARPGSIDPPRGLWLSPCGGGWRGDVACGVPLPLASESVGAVVLQHVAGRDASAWLDECIRVLVPGGRLSVYALNPLSPFRVHWQGKGLSGQEPVTWRRRLGRAGLTPDPVAQGIGPHWRIRPDETLHVGAGARAGYLIAAEKRRTPMTARRAAALGPALGESA